MGLPTFMTNLRRNAGQPSVLSTTTSQQNSALPVTHTVKSAQARLPVTAWSVLFNRFNTTIAACLTVLSSTTTSSQFVSRSSHRLRLLLSPRKLANS